MTEHDKAVLTTSMIVFVVGLTLWLLALPWLFKFYGPYIQWVQQ